jgi:transcriptional regulator with PAS, ATPase and Fis domain
MSTLLTFTGFHDPYSKGLIEGEELPGPVITLARSRSFSKIVLLTTPNTGRNTQNTLLALKDVVPTSKVVVKEMSLEDPTNYAKIFSGLRQIFLQLSEEDPNEDYFIGISSGTPQMHACWLLLAASGEIPARILMTRPPQFVSKDAPLVQEVNFVDSSFPIVRSQNTAPVISERTNLQAVVVGLNLVGDHPLMQKVLKIASTLAPTQYPVLILGETGTGKELFAKLIHFLSERDGPFVAVNCAAIPADLAESTLFGHVKGAFTGAVKDQKGEFEKADGGTLFLDELGELSPDMQAKLLRAIQEGIIQPVGGAQSKKLNLRIIAATNRDLELMVEKGQFREDLYHRLNTGELTLPALRDRKSDIPKIALNVLDGINKQQRKRSRITPEALQRLQQQHWPGNIRELQNVIERSVLLCPDEVLGPESLLIKEARRGKDPFKALPDPDEGFSMEEFISKIRKHFFMRALELANSNQSEAARLLDVSPQAVHKFVKASGEKS